jgi:hypothetical protein
VRAPRLRTLALAGLVVLLATAAFGRAWLAPRADVGAGFIAKQLCSCVFVGGRDEAACRLDFGPEFARVRSELLADGVRAWVPLLASRSAHHHEGTGCTLD